MERVRERNRIYRQKTGSQPLALIETFGCQQNFADSDKLRGMLERMGYAMTDSRERADLILFNTCAVREHAELRVLGNIGALKKLKEKKPTLVIGVGGCMMQQEHRAREILEKYRHVDLIFGTHTLHELPSMLETVLEKGERVRCTEETADLAEGLPISRESAYQAWVSVMYGCNNFCTYCIVPYLRGRERSRLPEDILEEVRALAGQGVREITLLGQNVNSYGKDLEKPISFAELLRTLNDVPGDFKIHFMTSHPKDCSLELLDALAGCGKVAKRLHLPVQAGSDRILKKMNRGYTAESYLRLLEAARARVPDLTITSDLIVGFPTETEEEFQETLRLVERARYDLIYTFLYSKRSGTPAAGMEGQIPEAVKKERLNRLMALQDGISQEKNQILVGERLAVLSDGPSKDRPNQADGRTEGGKIVHFSAETPPEAGQRCNVRITRASGYALYGELV